VGWEQAPVGRPSDQDRKQSEHAQKSSQDGAAAAFFFAAESQTPGGP